MNTQYNEFEDKSRPNYQVFEYNTDRTSHLGIMGLCYNGPLSHLWYSSLEKMVKPMSRQVYTVVVKMAFDAFLFTPFAVGGYFAIRGFLEGKRGEEVVKNVKKFWFKVYCVGLHVAPKSLYSSIILYC